jgi:hypothetical protein
LLMTSRCALRLVSLPLFCPEEDWSRRLNCKPLSPVLKPASFSARCNCGASCCSIDSVSGFSTVKCDVIWPLRSTSMRTSIRPRSAGSSRISKLLLPFLTEAAISSASPLNGTACVAAVAVNDPVAVELIAVEASCCGTATAVWLLASTGAVAVRSVVLPAA